MENEGQNRTREMVGGRSGAEEVSSRWATRLCPCDWATDDMERNGIKKVSWCFLPLVEETRSGR